MANEIELQVIALIEDLRIKEQKERSNLFAAIDIDDIAEAKDVMFNSKVNIDQLRKWIEGLAVIQKEISGSFLAASDVPTTQISIIQDSVKKEPESLKIEPLPGMKPNLHLKQTIDDGAGEYVRQKLSQLARSGLTFTEEQLENIQDPVWSRRTLAIPYQLAIISNEAKDILKETSVAKMLGSYGIEDEFVFGEARLLFYSDWDLSCLPYFDSWYDSLGVYNKNPQELLVSELLPGQTIEPQQCDKTVPEQIEFSDYVRAKLMDLCEANFQPLEQDLALWQDKEWSKLNFNLNCPFAKKNSKKCCLGEQNDVGNEMSHYWTDVFKLGATELLFCSQWNSSNREYFDRWYKDYLMAQLEEVQDMANSLSQAEETILMPRSDKPDITSSAEFAFSSFSAPLEFTLFGKVFQAKSWDNVLLELCEAMILKKPHKALSIGIKQLVKSNGVPVVWLDERGESEKAYKLSNGLSVAKNNTSGDVLSCCRDILGLCGYMGNELEFD